VQGVGFRATVAQLAERHPVVGFVRNEPDGSVTLVVQGQRAAIESLLDEVRSRFARHISAEERSEGPASERFDGFSIRR
jgi:acylphosphatase